MTVEAVFGDLDYAFPPVALADGGLRAGGLARASVMDRHGRGHCPYLVGSGPGCGHGRFPGDRDAPATGPSSRTARLPAAPAGHLAFLPPAQLVLRLRPWTVLLGLGPVHPGHLYLETPAGSG